MAMKGPTVRKRSKRVKPQVGDLFAIDLAGAGWGLGHIVLVGDPGTCYVLFAKHAPSIEALRTALDEAMKEPIGAVVSNDTDIRRGAWPVIGHREPRYPSNQLPKLWEEGGSIYTPDSLPNFIEAYNGLRPWDEGLATPKMYRAILLPHLSVPPTARYQNGSASAPVVPATSAPPAVTDGPAMLTIRISFPGEGMPSANLLYRRREMEQRLEARGAGEVEGTESGAGVMEIYLRTDEVRRAVPLAEKIAGELAFAKDMLIETALLEEDDDEEEKDA